MLTQSTLLELLSYCPASGKLWWRPRDRKWFSDNRSFMTWNSRYANKEALTVIKDGYKVGTIFGAMYRAHRVIWHMCFGYWPNEIDHENGDRADNRLNNLRDVTHKVNSQNTKISSNNTSGVMGVSFDRTENNFKSYIRIDGKMINLGRFAKIEDAVNSRKQAEINYNFHQNHGMR